MSEDPELQALTSVNSALQGLDGDAQKRVLDYVAKKLGLDLDTSHSNRTRDGFEAPFANEPGTRADTQSSGDTDDELDGISPVAKKWMRRSGLSINELGQIFSLGVDDIDVVAKSVPGSSVRERVRSVTLLKGLTSYLSSGVARITSEQIKEACLHYDAYDGGNHSKYIKSIAAELNANKVGEFTLTARGITSATELVKQMLGLTENGK
ncbi:hypothetical protein [Lacipirellula parvula]|uniref:Uncharacterized protein n=1 Tax=Lacipirellula parvula TaxID=2650471 RepID=A0A5K7XCN6_9BACT|nr:hypothetical protein [Lacipirellula parvula]BBO32591.1 hypothetical protein PLANPX_2203 [Lacipirellula parvula]